MDKTFLFVYGSLRVKNLNEMSLFLHQKGKWKGQGKMRGTLFLVSWYPAAVYEPFSQSFITGDIFEISEPDAVFTKLDLYEDTGSFEEPGEFKREMVNVRMNKEEVQAHVYLYNWPTGNLKKIESGDYLEFITSQE